MKLKCFSILFISFALLHITGVHAKTLRVLFIGNSYTYVNNLPQIIANMAASGGDTLVYDVSTPGGASFFNHADPDQEQNYGIYTYAKIRAGGWDYVILQEQSLGAATPPSQYNMYTYPYAKQLVDSIRYYNPCAEPIFYMTWGRKNGLPANCDTTWPPYCTYYAMDSVIRQRYMEMADSNHSTVSPVGAVWRYLRGHHPSIELYDADESHPSPAGSYAGACSFYTVLFKKPADSIQYNFSLSAADAATIRTASRNVVYDSMGYWHIGAYETIASFDPTANGPSVSFTNTSANATQYDWSFGDGQTSTAANPVHTYAAAGVYNVRLISTGAQQCRDTAYASVDVSTTGINHLAEASFAVTPNPATNALCIKSDLFSKDYYRMQLINCTGQLVLEQSSTRSAIQTIDVSAMAKGIYLLKISNERALGWRKIIVQ
jgi:hypothetical protein